MIDFIETDEQVHKPASRPTAQIKVLGMGGAGGNTINCMVSAGLDTIEFIVANTDAQALELSRAQCKLQIGNKLTKGLGSGSNPDVGKKAAEEDLSSILSHLENANIVFLTGGLGGGTGSGGLPVVAHQLREQGILTIAVVTKPFDFEGKRRMRVAEEALEKIKEEVDTLITIPNQALLDVADEHMSLIDAFDMVNQVITQFVRSISNIITRPGHINVDFADVKSIMYNAGSAVMGTGRASGPNRAEEATLQAISSPLLAEKSIQGARGILLNITGNKDIGLHEVSAASHLLYEQADEDANIVLGSVIDESMGNEIAVTIIATGFEPQAVRDVQPEKQEPLTVQATKKDESELETKQAAQPKVTELEAINLEDIEIPTILRKMVQEKQ